MFVNSTESPQALVVNASGSVTDITKYVPAADPARAGRLRRQPRADRAGRLAGNPWVRPGGARPRFRGPQRRRRPGAGSLRRRPLHRRRRLHRRRSTTALRCGRLPVLPAGSPPHSAAHRARAPRSSPRSAPATGSSPCSWSPPASDGGSPVLRYEVTATPSGAPERQVAAITHVTAT